MKSLKLIGAIYLALLCISPPLWGSTGDRTAGTESFFDRIYQEVLQKTQQAVGDHYLQSGHLDLFDTFVAQQSAGASGMMFATEDWLEAECASVGSAWTEMADADASNGSYLLPPNSTSTGSAPSGPEDLVTFTVDLDMAGNYKVFGRTWTTGGNDDSFWVRANGGAWVKWNRINSGNYGPLYQWEQVGQWNGGFNNTPVTFPLNAGINTIDFSWRESGARLDKIYVTLSGSTPTNPGPVGSNCDTGDNGDNDFAGDCCDQGDKPQKITARYTGEGCDATVTSQDPDKYNCSGNPNFDSQVYIISNDKEDPNDGKIWFSGNVMLGSTFEIDATNEGDDDLPSATFVHVFSSQGGSLLQTLEFHTSCSQPLSLADQYGAIDIEDILFKDGTVCGSLPAVSADCCDQGDKPQKITAIYTGEDCNATVSSQDTDKFSCTGDPAFDGQVFIIANDDDNPNNGKIWFSGTVDLGGEFVIDATAEGDDDLSSATFVHVFASQGGAVLQTVEFHTSCSQPLSLDDQYGAIAIDGILFKDGTTCGDAPPPAPDCCDIGDKPQKIKFTYTGEDCTATSTTQSADKYSCSGDPQGDALVYIIASDDSNPTPNAMPGDNGVWFVGEVALNESFDIDATLAGDTEFSSATFVYIYAAPGGALLQSLEFHTSCSQPLTEEDQYGALALDGILFKDGTTCGDAPPPPPTGGSDCCDIGDKPQQITVTYTGEDCSATVTSQGTDKYSCSGDPAFDGQVYIIANDNSNPGSGKIWFSGNVLLDESFVIDATAAGDSELSSATFLHVFASQGGALLQSLEFHTSCSQPISIDDQYGAIAIDFILFKDGTSCGPPPCLPIDPGVICSDEVNCGPFDPALITDVDCTDPPEPNFDGTSCCDSGEKPKTITMTYTGESCAATSTTQDASKWSCTGDPAAATAVYVVSSDKENPSSGDKFWFQGTVNLGETYIIDAGAEGDSKLPSDTWVKIYASQGGALLQTINFHTSCSQPLLIGDQYGASRIEEIGFEAGGFCTDLTNGGSASADCCDQGDKPSAITLTYTGEACGATVTNQPSDKWGCTGSPNFDPSVYIIANDNDDPNSGKIWFSGTVNLDETYTIAAANAGDSDFSSNTVVHIFASQGGALLQKVNFHTSCSQPLSADDQYGANRIESIEFTDGFVCGDPPNLIEYQWISSTDGCPTDISQAIPGATEATYDPPLITETTFYVRLSRSIFCTEDTDWQASNCVIKEVEPFGVCDPASLGDFVWEDVDRNGIQDPGEPGVPNVTVNLLDCNGNLLATTTTDANGAYLFDGLEPGGYIVEFTDLPVDFEFTPQDVGGDDMVDSDVDPNTGRTVCIPLAVGQQDLTWDAGLNNICDDITIGSAISGIGLVCDPGTGEDVFTLLDATPPPGASPDASYQWEVSTASEDGPFVEITGATGEDYNAPALTLGRWYRQVIRNSQTCTTEFFSSAFFVQLIQVNVTATGGTITCDMPTVQLTAMGSSNFSGPFDYSWTGPNGFMSNEQNPVVSVPGDYSVVATDQIGCSSSPPVDVTVEEEPCSSLGDTVFEDVDGDGIQDPGEPGVPNVTVNLLDCNGNLLATITTDANGNYLFDELNPGGYVVVFGPLPGDFEFTEANVGGNDAVDSDAGAGGATDCIDLPAGEDNLTVDAGIFEPASLGDFVFEDQDGDGIQDPGEPGIENVEVNLKDDNGNVIATDFTDANGAYEFTGLTPGTYTVMFMGPAGFEPTPQNQGGDDTVDSDADDMGNTDPVTLESGENNPTIDAGFFEPASIGDTVFEDQDGNGIQDPGEPGVPNIPVELQDCLGNTIATTMTDANGNYTFDNLPPGGYVVVFGPLPGTSTFTMQDVGGDDTIDSDADVNGVTDCIDLESGEDNTTVDAGVSDLASLGDFVWEDLNANGIQDPGEPGIENVEVNLKDDNGNVIATDFTDANGAYGFMGLTPGTYTVMFMAPGGFIATPQDQGGDDTVDSDADPNTGNADPVTLASGENNPTIDAGFYQPASLGDFVFEDQDGDGIQDPGEPGIENVEVNLKDDNGNVIATDFTDANGAYEFTGLTPGTYTVMFMGPAGFEPTPQNQGGDDTVDSDADDMGNTDPVTLESGENNPTIDAGFFEPASIGDTVFEDQDGNGIQDPGEPGVPNIPVELQDCLGNTIATTMTDANGNYTFDNLPPGGYVVVFGPLPGTSTFTMQDVGGDDTIDSDADVNGVTDCIDLESGEDNTTVDAGVSDLASLGDFVWEDLNANGIQDPGEPGIENVEVNLKDDNGNVIATDFTDANGAYGFMGLTPGTYTVMFMAPGGFIATPQDQGGDDTVDSDANPNTGNADPVTLASGENNPTIDAGFYQPASLGDFVFEDQDGDGIQDPGEPGIENVEVNLKDENGNVIATDFTDANGAYEFTGLTPGTYTVMFMGPAGFEPTPQNQGGDDTVDSDADDMGNTDPVTLESGENNPTIDAGFFEPASIGDTVFEDQDGNGIQDPGEPGVPNIPVELQDCLGNTIATTMTDANGNYTFDNLPPGGYVVVFGPLPGTSTFTMQDVGGDDTIDSDADVNGVTNCIDLESGEDNTTVDAGVSDLASLGDFVWEDLNANGIQDPGEPGIENVEVNLKDDNGNVIATDFTDANGAYGFMGLTPGTYTVMFMAPGGFIATPQDQGGDDTVDSDADPNTGNADPVTLASGENNPTIDAGFYQPASLGDFVFEDLNGNGIQDPGEPGIENVEVNLKDENGNVIATDFTDANGAYEFTGLTPGTYTVMFMGPAGFEPTPQNQGGDDTVDSDADDMGNTDPVTLESGENNPTIDAGFFEPASIGDTVFEDQDGNGIQDPGEPGVPNIPVELQDCLGNTIATTMTDANGNYTFDNLPPGGYVVVFGPLPGTSTFTMQDVGGDDTIDSDADVNGVTDCIDLESGEDNTTVDAGVSDLASLGDFVWEDLNANGIQDPGEPGIENVEVNLKDDNGNVIATDFTDANGAYGFMGLTPGTYTVMFMAPGGFIATPQDQGGDDTVDSDADPNTGNADPVTLASGENNPTIDAGFYQPASLGDFVFEDLNGNGIQDPGEPGVENAPVQLQDCFGNTIATTFTDANGNYSFDNLTPGGYVVVFGPLLGDFEFTTANAGADDAIDSDAGPGGATDCIDLESGENDDTVDAGIFEPASLGDRVFEDQDGDGIQDPGEPGVPNAPVQLRDCFGNTIVTTFTDANGNYSFDNLMPGGYVVVFGPLLGDFEFTMANAGADDAIDSDAGPGGATDCIDLESGENDDTVDAGIFEPASIGDTVFEDQDGNGIQDPGEPGVPNIPVELQDCLGNTIATTMTDANGNYTFDNLPPGGYVVVFGPLPGTSTFTMQDVGGDDTIDSDADVNGVTNCIDLESGEDNTTVDAGVSDLASLGDFVWEDLNANGIQDPGEPGIENVEVNLKDDNGNVIATDFTDANGAYGFMGLTPGTYTVMFMAPGGFIATPQDQGGDDTVDSDADPNTGNADPVTLGSGENNPTIDAGFYQPASLGDFVFEDQDGDGIQDPGEPGIENVEVNLKDDNGNVIATDFTDANGAYEFTGLTPGTYTVMFMGPAGFEPTPQNQGGDDTVDSDADDMGNTDPVTLESGENNPTIDAGFFEPASIGDTVFEDQDGNGIQDPGEPGVPNIPVELQDCLGNTIATTMTDANGNYTFDNLPPGGYVVVFGPLPGTSTFTMQDVGGDDTIDSDADVNGVTDCIDLESGEDNTTVDAGVSDLASLGDFVWEDLNANGIQDPGEPGIENVEVNLKDDNGNVIATDFTDANGAYGFMGLTPGTYTVMFMAPGGFIATPQDQGGDDTVDSDADPNTGNADPVTLGSGENNPTIDAGFYQPASLGDFVFEDQDGDGIQDPGEPGIENVEVNLKDDNGNVIATDFTDANGAYEFTGLTPGTYTVMFMGPAGFEPTPQNQGGDDTVDSDADDMGNTDPVTLESGENNPTIDAGFFEPASIGDTVFEDQDGNGIQDPGEPGVPNIPVELQDCLGNTIATTMTDANGNYTFDNLPPGGYVVVFGPLPGTSTFTMQDVGGDDTIDSDADVNGVTDCIDLESGEDNTTVDAGVSDLASLGDFVWEDLNANGIQDPGEPGIENVEVNLKDDNGNVIATDFTDANGAYGFMGLTPGTYTVMFMAPGGFIATPQDQGGDDTVDSDADPNTGNADPVTLASGENNPTIDAGFYQPASLGDFVFEDQDGDGIQDPGEPGIENVEVNLKDDNGNVIATDFTDANGAYEFTGLTPGTYTVMFMGPAGFEPTPQNQGGDDTVDSDADDMGNTDPVTLESGENNPTIDAGFFEPASIGDTVFEDQDGNGIQDPGEPGVPNIPVELQDCLGNTIATTMTDANGNYTFDNLPPGGYVVVFGPLPAGFSFTDANVGGDDAIDSDADVNGVTGCIDLESGDNNDTVDAGLRFSDCGTVTVSGPGGPVCPDSNQGFTATIDGLCDNPVYFWSVSGNGTIIADNGSSITVMAGSDCGADYTVNLDVQCDGCDPNLISAPPVVVSVNDNTAPELSNVPGDVSIPWNVNGCVTFEEFEAGDIVSTVFTTNGLGPILVKGINPNFGPAINAAMVFNTSDPSDDDFDLGTPNETFGGPGIGAGGEEGMPFENNRSLGKIIMVSEDLNSDVPDDIENTPGVIIEVDFSAIGALTMLSMDIVDIEAVQMPTVELYGAADNLLETVMVPVVGDNGLTRIDLGNTAGVTRMVVNLNGSGGIDNICFTDPNDPVPPVPGDVTASDLCDPNPMISFDEMLIPGNCAGDFTLIRTWTATDACGNSASESQTITFTDTEGPSILGVPQEVITVDCDNVPVPVEPLVVDNCDPNPGLTMMETNSPGDCSTGFTITRTWTATDGCGNSTVVTQTIEVMGSGQPLNDLWLEAECATVGSMWTVETDMDASNEEYVLPPNQTSTSNVPDELDDLVTFTFDVATSGQYKVFGRTRTTSGDDDSFWVRANGGSWVRWNRINSPNYGPFYQWQQVGQWNGGNFNSPVTFQLNAGTNTVDFAWREPGARLDKIHVTLDGSKPNGIGPAGGGCTVPNSFVPQGANASSTLASDMKLKVYPVPSDGQVTLEIYNPVDPDRTEIRVFDASGREMLHRVLEDNTKAQLDLGQFGKGLYILKVLSGNEIRHQRVIIQ